MSRIARRVGLVGTVMTVIGLGVATPSFASVGNGSAGTAIAISALPYSHTEDTTSATSDPSNPTDCTNGTPTVWFKFKATRSQRLTVSTVGSNYGIYVGVYQGTPTSLTPVVCFYGSYWDILTTPGVTYFFMVSRCCDTGPNFNLAFHLVRPPKVAGTVYPHGSVRWVDGVATVSGTVTCSRRADATVGISLVQRVSRTLLATGSATFDDPKCSTTPTGWSGQIVPGGFVPFVKGAAAATLSFSACDSLGSCSDPLTLGPVTINLS